jgi:diadenosine tetraphosphate (Ap4A) HIT family hydrolase
MCQICDVIAGNSKKVYDKILIESKNFFVLPSLGSIVPNWFIICSKAHILSGNGLTSTQFSELEILIEEIKNRIGITNEKLTIFEHGPSKENISTGCSVDHFHLHLIEHDSKEIFEMSLEYSPEFKWKNKKSFNEAISSIDSKQSYLYLRINNKHNLICQKDEFESQYFRKIIAKSQNLDKKYSWRCDYFIDNIKTTIRNFYNSELSLCPLKVPMS